MAINFFRVFVWDFLEGVKCSVKGFFVRFNIKIYKLINYLGNKRTR